MLDYININSSVAVYVQIENQVLFAVASGQLKADDKLPSAQELAKRLNVNFNTIGKSYRDLEVMGILYTRRGMGVFVNKGVEAKCRENCRQRIVRRIHEVVAEAKAAGLSSAEIKNAFSASFATDSHPYGDTPDSILALAKPKK